MGSFAGVINVCKEKGYTSFDVVAILRRLFKVKCGHTGTLDPNATGVLPICLGNATKFSEYFMGGRKSYTAEVVLGITTDTGDTTGNVLARNTCFVCTTGFSVSDESIREKRVSRQDIINAVLSFKGKQEQVPPMYSAIKVGGRRLYEIARKGQVVERKARPVEIYDIEAHSFCETGFLLNVDCSKGTYIRSLCTDIGEKLGCGAAMGSLERTASGPFHINDALTIGEIEAHSNVWSLAKPIEELLPYPVAYIVPAYVKNAKNGNAVKLTNLISYDENSKKHWLKDENDLIGLFRLEAESIKCEVML